MSRFTGSSRDPNVIRRFDLAAADCAPIFFSPKYSAGTGCNNVEVPGQPATIFSQRRLMTSHRVPDIFRPTVLRRQLFRTSKASDAFHCDPVSSHQLAPRSVRHFFFQYANEATNIRQIKMLIVGTDEQNQRITDL